MKQKHLNRKIMITFFYMLKNAYVMANADRKAAKSIMQSYADAIVNVSKKHVLVKNAVDVIEDNIYFFPKKTRQNMVTPLIELYYGGIKENGMFVPGSCVDGKFNNEVEVLKDTYQKIKKLYNTGKFKEIVDYYGENNPKKVGKLEYQCDKD